EGRNPNSPTIDAGYRIEPPASLACAIGRIRAATIAAAPPDEPPAETPARQGFSVVPRRADSVLPSNPNSELVVEHTICNPDARRRSTYAEAGGAGLAANSREPIVQGSPGTPRSSFTANGTPANLPVAL